MRTRAVIASLSLIAAASAAIAADQPRTDRARADDPAAGLARTLAGLTRRGTTTCLPLYRTLGQTTAYGPDIVYDVSRSLKYVSHTAGGCEGAGHGDILITRQYQSRPCSGDIATTVDNASRFPTGSCALGDFTEYRK